VISTMFCDVAHSVRFQAQGCSAGVKFASSASLRVLRVKLIVILRLFVNVCNYRAFFKLSHCQPTNPSVPPNVIREAERVEPPRKSQPHVQFANVPRCRDGEHCAHEGPVVFF